MSAIDSVAQKYRGLYLTAIAQGLEPLLGQAEANAVSYLHFAETLVELELQQRNGKRIEQNQRRAGFPVQKRKAWMTLITAFKPTSANATTARMQEVEQCRSNCRGEWLVGLWVY